MRSVPPLTNLDGRSCHDRPELASALPLESGKSVKSELDVRAPCLAAERPTGRSVYAVVRLPQADEPYLLDVTSRPLGMTLMSPRLMLLDAQGNLLREVARDAFNFRGSTLHAGLWAQPGDAYLVVASDPGSVGQLASRLSTNTHVNAVPVGAAVFMVHTGSEGQTAYVFAHNGEIEVAARAAPKVN